MSLTDDDNAAPPASEAEAEFLTRAVDLARDNATVGQLPFGAVVVRTAPCWRPVSTRN